MHWWTTTAGTGTGSPCPPTGRAAVGAEHAFLSTCGSSLSVKAAMLAVVAGFVSSAYCSG
jgi:hypothetical protein